MSFSSYLKFLKTFSRHEVKIFNETLSPYLATLQLNFFTLLVMLNLNISVPDIIAVFLGYYIYGPSTPFLSTTFDTT